MAYRELPSWKYKMEYQRCSVQCLDCGTKRTYSPKSPKCPSCLGQWAEALYDYKYLSQILISKLEKRDFDLWRYWELLPIGKPNSSLMLGEGGTPLIPAINLGLMLGCPNIFIKDERQGPTSSFKDRQAAVTISALKEAGITEMVVASTGNVAISYSAYAARAGIKLWAFVTSLVPAVKMREIAMYGSQVVKVTGSYDQAKKMAAEFAFKRDLYLDVGSRTISSVEAMKTISYEVAEQLAKVSRESSNTKYHHQTPWFSPDWYLQAVSGGMGPLGVAKGFSELLSMGFVQKLPALGLIQTNGCSPMVNAWSMNADIAQPVVTPQTHIETLATGDPGRTYTFLKKICSENHGLFESVTDEEAFRAMHVLAKMEGISTEPAAAVAFAGLFKLVRSGQIKPSDVVVINCTGHTMPAEPFILGDNWTRDIEFPSLKDDVPQEGLLAALNQIAPDRYPFILIVDDSEDSCRLIRRILQSQGNFSIIEVNSGKAALASIQKQLPDLIILDLMMPEMDGFALLDLLKHESVTARIPVIVATAKELTSYEKGRLQGQIKALMQKGDFLSDEFLAEVNQVFN